jgi:O-acetyl-ADP-ribose deacetylase (regulator of RNase III)
MHQRAGACFDNCIFKERVSCIPMSKEWRMKIVLQQGDLTGAATDAIVNAANNDLILGGGVAGAIRSKGGPTIQQECDAIGPVNIGEAVITGAGRLRANYVIHAASMRLGGRTTAESLRDSTRNSLRRAEEKQLSSIAFPAIGTGIAGFSLDQCAEIMLAEVRDHLKGTTSLKRVQFVLFDQKALDVFERALTRIAD